MTITARISSVALLERAIALAEIPDAPLLYVDIIRQAIAANNQANDSVDVARRAEIDRVSWEERALRAERRANALFGIALTCLASVVVAIVGAALTLIFAP
jgi:hypothetical protein